MPLVLRDRLGLFSIFPIAVINLIVPAVVLFVYQFQTTVALVCAWVYVYLLFIQTRLMAALLISGWVMTPLIAHFTEYITMFQATYSMGVFTGTVIAAHLVAFGISAITGFRL
jgi:hypothetical protein